MDVRSFLSKIADVIFPYVPKCVVCGVEKNVVNYLCPKCASWLEELKAGESQAGGFGFSLYKYDGAVKGIVTGYKYGGKKWLGRFLGREMAQALSELPQSFSCVCNVPLHEKRRKSRGFDQSEELAKGLSEAAGLPYIPALRRIRNTKTQTKLSEKQRAENIKGAFEAACPVSGKVLLVDDVLTTGATAGECARTLMRAGAESVYVVTYARAVMRGRRELKGVRRLIKRHIKI